MRLLPAAPWRGLTVDDVNRVDSVVLQLRKVPFRAIVRLVIDYPQRSLDEYDLAVTKLSAVADVMLQVRDSYAEEMEPLRPSEFLHLFLLMVGRWRNQVAVWEVGNEVNGTWLPPDIGFKVRLCLGEAKRQGLKTAVTFYMEQPLMMQQWALLHGIECDVALISWYPRSTPGFNPDWQAECRSLSQACGGALVGGGEFGTEDEDGNQLDSAGTAQMIAAVEKIRTEDVRWIGGWFFWDFCAFCLPPIGQECLTAWIDGWGAAGA